MGIGTYSAIYFIMWWISLFLVLPFSGKSQAEEGEVVLGTTKSAPANLKVLRIVIMNSIVASVFFICFFLLVEVFGVTYEDFTGLFPKF
jgi:predicted secreted protein